MKEITRQEYETLCDEIWHHNRVYFQESKPEISDEEFDKLVRKLEEIEEKHPEWVSKTSPSKRVGEKPLSGFQEIQHKKPMLSLEKAFTEEEVQAFHERLERLLGKKELRFCSELKMDGLAVSVTYENGQFNHGVTRGDGKVGSDVSENLRTIQSLPLRLTGKKIPPHIEVRGEVFIPTDEFLKMNEQRKKSEEELWANPRNAASGSLKLLDPKEVAKRKELSIVFYAIAYEPALPIKSQSEVHEYLHELGLPTLSSFLKHYIHEHREYSDLKDFHPVATCQSVEEIMNYAKEVEKRRKRIPFGIDGVVVKLDELASYDTIGNTGKHPRGAIAFKFTGEQAWTTIKAITFQVGRTGAVTPVAELEPVFLAGSTISRATLHNFDEVARKDIRVGDIVSIEKGGDVIPKVVSVDLEQRPHNSTPLAPPTICPSCKTPLVHDESEVALRCPNKKECPEQKQRSLAHFVGKNGLDIENLGEKVVAKLIEKGFVNRPSDIFKLTKEQLAELEGFKDKSIKNLLESIEKAKKVPLSRLLMALGIRYVGAQATEILAREYDLKTLEHLSQEELRNTQGVGEKMAESIYAYFHDPENLSELHELEKAGVSIEKVEFTGSQDHPLYKKTLVITGTLQSFSRHEAEERIKKVGGSVSDSVGKKTDFLVVGVEPGSKLQKAEKLNVKILNEQEFLKILE